VIPETERTAADRLAGLFSTPAQDEKPVKPAKA
jgi:hypothetical protein